MKSLHRFKNDFQNARLPPRCNRFYQYVERNWRRKRRWWKSGHGAPFQVILTTPLPQHKIRKGIPDSKIGQRLTQITWQEDSPQDRLDKLSVGFPGRCGDHRLEHYIISCYILSIMFYQITLYCSKLDYTILYQIELCYIVFILYYYIIIKPACEARGPEGPARWER